MHPEPSHDAASARSLQRTLMAAALVVLAASLAGPLTAQTSDAPVSDVFEDEPLGQEATMDDAMEEGAMEDAMEDGGMEDDDMEGGAGEGDTAGARDRDGTDCGLYEAVEPGDTFRTIMRRCGVPFAVLKEANPGLNPANLAPGTVISLSPGTAPAAADAAADARGGRDGAGGARALYRSGMVGLWRLPKGACDRKRGTWDLMATEIRVRTDAACEIAGIATEGDGVTVDLTCAEGERTLSFTPDGADTLKVRGTKVRQTLTRCPQ